MNETLLKPKDIEPPVEKIKVISNLVKKPLVVEHTVVDLDSEPDFADPIVKSVPKTMDIQTTLTEVEAPKAVVVETNTTEVEAPQIPDIETTTTIAEAPAKKYRPGPKSRKRFLKIKDDLHEEASPNKRAKCDPQLEAFVKVLSIKAFCEESAGAKHEIVFQLFKIWFGQLDSVKLKCAECGNIQPDSWQLMNAAEVVEQEVVNRAVEKEVIADLLVQSGEKKNKKTYKN